MSENENFPDHIVCHPNTDFFRTRGQCFEGYNLRSIVKAEIEFQSL